MVTDEGNGRNEIWTLNKRWNWSTFITLALSASWTQVLRAQSVRAPEQNSVVAGSNPAQANGELLISTSKNLLAVNTIRKYRNYPYRKLLYIRKQSNYYLSSNKANLWSAKACHTSLAIKNSLTKLRSTTTTLLTKVDSTRNASTHRLG